MDTSGPSSVSENTSRRRMLTLIGAGGAAFAASLLPQGVARAGHGDGVDPDALHLGESNTAPTDSGTGVDADVDNFAFGVRNNNTGEAAGAIRGLTSGLKPAISAETDADDGVAIDGTSSGPGFGDAGNFGNGNGIGVRGGSGSGTGVAGSSGSGTGVRGQSETGTAVEAISGPVSKGPSGGQALSVIGTAQIEASIDPGAALGVTNLATGDGAHGILATAFGTDKPAVYGEGRGGGAGVSGVSSSTEGFADGTGDGVSGTTGSGIAVRGETPNGVGVRGHSNTHIGVWASADTGAAALHVSGRAVFETAGSGVVPAGSNDATVAASFVGPNSQVIVTLTGNPGNRQLRWIELNPGVGFIVHLSPAPPNGRPATPFVYLVVDRAT